MVSGNHPAIRPTEVVHVVTSKGIQRVKGKHENHRRGTKNQSMVERMSRCYCLTTNRKEHFHRLFCVIT